MGVSRFDLVIICKEGNEAYDFIKSSIFLFVFCHIKLKVANVTLVHWSQLSLYIEQLIMELQFTTFNSEAWIVLFHSCCNSICFTRTCILVKYDSFFFLFKPHVHVLLMLNGVGLWLSYTSLLDWFFTPPFFSLQAKYFNAAGSHFLCLPCPPPWKTVHIHFKVRHEEQFTACCGIDSGCFGWENPTVVLLHLHSFWWNNASSLMTLFIIREREVLKLQH